MDDPTLEYRIKTLEQTFESFKNKNSESHHQMRADISEMSKASIRTDERYITLIGKVDGLYSKVDEMQSKPHKRWETVIAAIITAVVGFLIALALNGGLNGAV